MTTQIISMKSTKAEIIEAAEELISSQEIQLKVIHKQLRTHKQVLKLVTILLAITFVLAPLF